MRIHTVVPPNIEQLKQIQISLRSPDQLTQLCTSAQELREAFIYTLTHDDVSMCVLHTIERQLLEYNEYIRALYLVAEKHDAVGAEIIAGFTPCTDTYGDSCSTLEPKIIAAYMEPELPSCKHILDSLRSRSIQTQQRVCHALAKYACILERYKQTSAGQVLQN